MGKWVVCAKRADFQKISQEFGIDPVIARLIRNRDVEGTENIRSYLYGTLKELPSPWLLKDMDKAVEILQEKIKEHRKIRIIGDYDIDGVTSTCILLKGFQRLGADADTYIPDRIKDGYGIHEQLIQKAVEDGIDTIVTCDNGIAASAEIADAKERGLTVVITDHHDIPFQETENGKEWIIPPADAVINPKQADCAYPNKNLCGAVVAWKLIWALYEKNGISQSEVLDFTELAAVATVGDVMDLQGENRIIVKEGLRQLSATHTPGLRALIRANNLDGAEITAYHVGFVLGPCINASGRLDTAARSLELLCETNEEKAAELAGDLLALNQSRKAMTEKGKEEAIRLIEETGLNEDRVLVVYLPDCHESLAGIIAGRIREKYHKPVFVLTKGENSVKGSGRSIEAYSMYEEMVKCGDLLIQFGGHPMAAGLSIEEKNVELFRKQLNANCTLTEEELRPKIVIDVPMPVSYLSRELTEQLKILEPFGKGNTKPIFAQKGLRVLNLRIFGKNQNVAKMKLEDQTGMQMDAVYFGEAEKFADFVRQQEEISVTYYPEINVYQGLVHIWLRHGNVILESARDRFVHLMDDAKGCITVLDCIYQNTDCKQIINLIDRLVLIDHLLVNTEEMLDSSIHLCLDSGIVHMLLDLAYDIIDKFLAFTLTKSDLVHKIIIYIRFEIFQ
jgi:single-stranded-DNA-specific exonuclease